MALSLVTTNKVSNSAIRDVLLACIGRTVCLQCERSAFDQVAPILALFQL